MLPPVFQWLRASAAVTALLGNNPTRIYRHGSAPQDAAGPYVTWFVVVGVPQNVLDEAPRVDAMTVQVDCWSDNTGTGSSGIDVLARAVRDALEPHGHMTAIVADERNTQTDRYRIGMTFDFWQPRS